MFLLMMSSKTRSGRFLANEYQKYAQTGVGDHIHDFARHNCATGTDVSLDARKFYKRAAFGIFFGGNILGNNCAE